MKVFLFTLSILILAFSSPCFAQDSLDAPDLWAETEGITVHLSWQPVAEADGYILYYAPYPDLDYINTIDLGASTEITADLWEDAAFYAAVQAYAYVDAEANSVHEKTSAAPSKLLGDISRIVTLVMSDRKLITLGKINVTGSGSNVVPGSNLSMSWIGSVDYKIYDLPPVLFQDIYDPPTGPSSGVYHVEGTGTVDFHLELTGAGPCYPFIYNASLAVAVAGKVRPTQVGSLDQDDCQIKLLYREEQVLSETSRESCGVPFWPPYVLRGMVFGPWPYKTGSSDTDNAPGGKMALTLGTIETLLAQTLCADREENPW